MQWEQLNVELRYRYGNKIVKIKADSHGNNVLEEIQFLLEKGL